MSDNERLSQIETLWSVVRRSHVDQQAVARAAQEELCERYGGAIRRYLRAALRDEVAADDVYQEFAIRFVRGDFQHAAPERGRFRSFLKTVLFRLVADYYRSRARRPMSLDNAPEAPSSPDAQAAREQTFNGAWRDEVLERTWRALEAVETSTGRPLYSVLRLRVDDPNKKSSELADDLSRHLGRPITLSNLRVILHRSRETFADLLLEIVAQTLDAPSRDDLEAELADLNLLDYCRSALARWR
jgi:RNA polymerase sigma-70 factor (ECF subfamily)